MANTLKMKGNQHSNQGIKDGDFSLNMPPIGHLESDLARIFVVTYLDMHQLAGAPELGRLVQWCEYAQVFTVRTSDFVSKGRSFAGPLI